jgi:hypothetical protein
LSSPPPEAAKVIDAYPDQERLTQPHPGRIGEHRRAGLNLAVDLRRLGAVFPLGLAGVVGHDAHGWLVRDACAALGIDTIPLPKVPDVATSSTDAMVVRDGGLGTPAAGSTVGGPESSRVKTRDRRSCVRPTLPQCRPDDLDLLKCVLPLRSLRGVRDVEKDIVGAASDLDR